MPIGLARSCPAMSGAEPWIGSYRPCSPCAVRRVPTDADGSIPSEPARTEASSDRMSPKRFSVTRTSNEAGERTICMAHASTSRSSRATSGYSAATSWTTVRQRRDVARTFALSTLVSFFRRPRASSNARRATRATSGSEYGSRSCATRAPAGPVASLRAPK